MLKKTIILFLFPFVIYSQTKITQTQKYKQVGLVWGLLKYHHPDISKGEYNWDLELISFLNSIEDIEEQEKLNPKLDSFISKYDKSTTKYKIIPLKIDSEKIFRKNFNYDWINEFGFTPEIKNKLTKLKNNGNIGDYYASSSKLNKMISFNNEKGLPNFNAQLKNHRLLELYSYWNIIQYWNVNKYLTDINWVDTLDELIKNFVNANTIEEYEISKLNMFALLNDSHSYKTSTYFYESLFKYSPPFGIKIINDSLLVTSIYNKTLAENNNIDLGEIIVKVNNQNIPDYIKTNFSKLISVSNETYLKHRLNRLILRNSSDSLKIHSLDKNGNLKEKKIKLFNSFKVDGYKTLIKTKKADWKKVSSKITYINLANINSKEFSKVLKENENDDGIILDLRNYPRNLKLKDFSKYLFPEKKEFIKILIPLDKAPSLGEYPASAPLKFISNPFEIGKNNSNYFKGKIILLVNRQTGSMAEYFGMAIQQSPNCITIGEQTMGAVMNITSAILPDKQEFYFTGIGAFYPNGDMVQRKGLHIDYYIKENIKDYDSKPYIDKAVTIIKENKLQKN
ncbi:S41 family peptidase [Tenacibaculum aestuarii]|uniref:S41 family peptidase n=1 Tax=Tenacibaculum aestuarii TaxID=362781 RepID=UPI0038952AAB